MHAMAFMNVQTLSEVRKQFARLRDPVTLVVFSQALEAADRCLQTERLARELAELSDRIRVEVLNPAIDRERAQAYGVDRVPAIVVEGARDYGIRFYGVPAGYEFGPLVDAIVAVSRGEAELAPATREALATLGADVDIKVFSTPT